MSYGYYQTGLLYELEGPNIYLASQNWKSKQIDSTFTFEDAIKKGSSPDVEQEIPNCLYLCRRMTAEGITRVTPKIYKPISGFLEFETSHSRLPVGDVLKGSAYITAIMDGVLTGTNSYTVTDPDVSKIEVEIHTAGVRITVFGADVQTVSIGDASTPVAVVTEYSGKGRFLPLVGKTEQYGLVIELTTTAVDIDVIRLNADLSPAIDACEIHSELRYSARQILDPSIVEISEEATWIAL